jgi:hypothetical protein
MITGKKLVQIFHTWRDVIISCGDTEAKSRNKKVDPKSVPACGEAPYLGVLRTVRTPLWQFPGVPKYGVKSVAMFL